MNRIVFTGSQGTGKTTLLNVFKERNYDVITEVVRNLAKNKKTKINKDGDEKGQKLIFKEYSKLLSQISWDGYISDRCLIDVLAYTMHLAKNGKVGEELVEKQKNDLKKFIAKNPDIIYCYFPIEFPVEADGTRDTDEEYRKEIDDNIKSIINELGLRVITMSGSVEDRVKKMERIYAWRFEGLKLFTNQ
jgi:predicted ATPase